jgi:hypothetical protein
VIAPGGLATKARIALDDLLVKPTAVVAKGQVAPSEKSEFAVEILARAADGSTTPRPAKLVDGLPFVELAPADVLEIRVLNHSKAEAVGRVAIDGLDLFAFDPKGAGHAPLAPATEGRLGGVTIPGWPTGVNPETKQLTFADLTPAGYATLADKPRGKVGVISVAVSRGAGADEPPTEFVTIRFRRGK